MRGAGGVELADAVGDNGEDAAATAELCSLGGGEAGRKAVNSVVIGVDELGRGVVSGKGGERAEDGRVPVVVGGENGGLLGLGNMDDVGFPTVG